MSRAETAICCTSEYSLMLTIFGPYACHAVIGASRKNAAIAQPIKRRDVF